MTFMFCHSPAFDKLQIIKIKPDDFLLPTLQHKTFQIKVCSVIILLLACHSYFIYVQDISMHVDPTKKKKGNYSHGFTLDDMHEITTHMYHTCDLYPLVYRDSESPLLKRQIQEIIPATNHDGGQ